MTAGPYDRLRDLLAEQYRWPSPYLFKFVVPLAQLSAVLALFDEGVARTRESKNGNYVSVTAEVVMQSPQQVVDVYLQAEKIEGIISI